MTTDILPQELRKRADSSALMGFFTAIIGFFAIVYSLGGGAISPPVLGWILVLTAITQFIFAFNSRPAGNFIAMVVIAAMYAIGGIALAVFVTRRVVTLSSVVGVLLIVESMLDTIIAFRLPRFVQGREGFLFSALATLLLGTLALGRGPASVDWVPSIFLGVAILINGGTQVLIASKVSSEV